MYVDARRDTTLPERSVNQIQHPESGRPGLGFMYRVADLAIGVLANTTYCIRYLVCYNTSIHIHVHTCVIS